MIVSVFGASGRTGKAFVKLAAESGLYVRAHYRTAPLEPSPDTVTVVVGALTDPTAVREVLRGADAVVVLLGPHPSAHRVFCATATKAILAGMATQNVPRILCVTGAMIGERPSNVSLALKLMSVGARRTEQGDTLADRDAQERAVRSSPAAWTMVKPATLTDGLGTEFEAGPAVSVGLSSRCTRLSLATFLVAEVTRPQYATSAVYVKDR